MPSISCSERVIARLRNIELALANGKTLAPKF
jgi:hypothetical protein